MRQHERPRDARRRRDETLQHPRCVFQILQAPLPPLHAGDGRAGVRRAAGALRAGGRDALRATRAASAPRAFCYAVGWTQHTVGVQYIRTASILQLLLGQHRPARRRDHGAARPRLDPGLDRHPHALQPPRPATCRCRTPAHDATLEKYLERNTSRRRAGGASSPSTSSRLLKAWFGDAATKRERLPLRRAAAAHRRPLPHDHGGGHGRRQGARVLRDGREPGGRLDERRGCSARGCASWSGWWSGTSR